MHVFVNNDIRLVKFSEPAKIEELAKIDDRLPPDQDLRHHALSLDTQCVNVLRCYVDNSMKNIAEN